MRRRIPKQSRRGGDGHGYSVPEFEGYGRGRGEDGVQNVFGDTGRGGGVFAGSKEFLDLFAGESVVYICGAAGG